MKDFGYDFFDGEEADEETIEELKKANKQNSRSFSSVINKKKLSKQELDDVMSS